MRFALPVVHVRLTLANDSLQVQRLLGISGLLHRALRRPLVSKRFSSVALVTTMQSSVLVPFLRQRPSGQDRLDAEASKP